MIGDLLSTCLLVLSLNVPIEFSGAAKEHQIKVFYCDCQYFKPTVVVERSLLNEKGNKMGASNTISQRIETLKKPEYCEESKPLVAPY